MDSIHYVINILCLHVAQNFRQVYLLNNIGI